MVVQPCSRTQSTPDDLRFMIVPLTRKKVNRHFGSNNPIKKLLFSIQHKPYALTVMNPTAQALTLQTDQWLPKPLNPVTTMRKLAQSMAAAPWLIGIGWGVFITKVIGFAIIPAVLLSATIIASCVMSLSNQHLPKNTQQTIDHLLIDGIHGYTIAAHSSAEFMVICPRDTKQLVITYVYQAVAISKTMFLH